MQVFEYKVVPAPNRPKRVKGVKGNAPRFAVLLTETMNEQAKDGWQYLRSDSLPVEEKPGLLKSRIENYHTVLVFQRPVVVEDVEPMAGYIEDHSDTPDPDVMAEPEAPIADAMEEIAEAEAEEQDTVVDVPADPTPERPPLTASRHTDWSTSAPEIETKDAAQDSPFSSPRNEDSKSS